MVKILLFLIFFIYNFTQSKYLFGGDSPEFLLSQLTFSIPHPPGYPLYSFLLMIFAKILFFIKPLTVANLISIFSHIASIYLIYRILTEELNINKNIALVSIFYFSLLYLVWLYSIIPEVFALNNLIVSGIIYFGLKFNRTKNKKILYLFYFFIALGIAHHHSFILFVIPFFILNRRFFTYFILFIPFVSAVFYLYPFFSSLYLNPPIDWENAKTIEGLIRLITRSSYGTLQAYFGSIPNFINQTASLVSTFLMVIGDFLPAGLLLIIFGFYFLTKNKKNYLFFKNYFLFSFFFYVIFLYITNFNLSYSFSLATYERYLIAFYLILIFPFTIGLNFINNLINKRLLRKISFIVIYLFVILLLLTNFFNSYRIIKELKKAHQYNQLAYDILFQLNKNSILMLKSDLTYFPFSYFYYQHQYSEFKKVFLIFPAMFQRQYYIEKIKKEYPEITIPANGELNLFFKKNHLPIYSESTYNIGLYAPHGLIWQYYDSKDSLKKDINQIIKNNLIFWVKNKSLLSINKNLTQILFYKSLAEYYQEKMFNFVLFLADNNLYKELNEFLTDVVKIYPSENYLYFNKLVKDYFLKNKSCQQKYLKENYFCFK